MSHSKKVNETLGIHHWHPLVVDSSVQAKLSGEFPGVSQRGTHPQSEVSNSVGLADFLKTQSGNILDAPSSEAERETDAHKEEREMIQAFMRDRNVEVVAVVEGMDAATGGVVQARHSYTVDEIQWHHEHVVCVLEDPESGGAMIDFSRFHDVAPTSMDSAFASAVSQI
jgi:polyphosphate kinase 2 (PPK2 family)